MHLHDIGKSPDSTFKKINQHLETNYGFKISESVSDQDLVSIMEQIQGEITDLKVKGDDAKTSPEISKRLLVLEGITSLREFAMMQFQSPKLDSTIQNLVDFVVDTFEISGYHGHPEFEKAIEKAMDEYRSSRYRFPDEMIEQRVRQEAMARIQSEMGGPAEHMMEDESDDDSDVDNEASEDSEMKGIDLEEKHWIHTDPKKRGMFKGKDAGDINSEKAALKAKDAKHPGHVSAADKTKMHELEFAARAKSGGLEEEQVNEISSATLKGYTDKADPWKRPQGTAAAHSRQQARAGAPKSSGHLPGYDKEIEEDDMYGSVGKRASAMGGHAAQAPDTAQAKHAMKVLDNPKLSLAPQHDEPVNMVRDQNGRMVPKNSWAAPSPRNRMKEGTDMKEQQNLVKNLRRLLETEVSQAEVMMAAKGFAQELQEMVEKIGRLQNEDLPPVVDQMRETYGQESASAFQTQIYGAMQGVMDALFTAKTQVDDAVGNMATTGQFSAQTDMDVPMDGMDNDLGAIDAGAEAGADLDNLDADLQADDEFGGAEEEEPLGRGMKTEAAMQKKVLEMQKLVAKARKLREARG